MSYNELTLSGFASKRIVRVDVTSATIVVCNVWAVATTSLDVKPIVRDEFAVFLAIFVGLVNFENKFLSVEKALFLH